MRFESKLIPIMREGVEVIKMIFFKKLKAYLSQKYPERETSYINKLSGAIINDLFGTPNPGEPFATFVKENRACIAEEMDHIAVEFDGMRIPLTDALRVQFLCDNQEGIDNSRILARAQELHILLVDREVPLPRHFLDLVRKLGNTFGFLVPQDQV
ncbi:MAG: hypothetical protein QME44_09980 [Thermodesulfobacteriota bacterium]|nr:hypothetical protein [Thermodesulfobacteriota bacterium]